MEHVIACTIIILACLLFAYMCFRLYAYSSIGGNYSVRDKYRDCIEQIRLSTRWREYFFIFSVSFVFLFRGALGVFVAAIAGIVSTVIIGASPCVAEDTLVGEIARYIWENVGKPYVDLLN